MEVLHSRQLPAPAGLLAGERPIGRKGSSDVHLPDEVFLRHAAFIGGTGSGKSTQLIGLAADDLAAGRGFTFLDPMEMPSNAYSTLCRMNTSSASISSVSPNAGPRAASTSWSSAERTQSWWPCSSWTPCTTCTPRYSGPKQTHYLRMALLTLLAREPEAADGPWTVVDLYQLLVNRDVRRRFTGGPERRGAARLLAARVAAGQPSRPRAERRGRPQQAGWVHRLPHHPRHRRRPRTRPSGRVR